MRRTVLLMVSIALGVLFVSGVALAMTINCTSGIKCFGTTDSDTMTGSTGDDLMAARAGNDRMDGNDGEDDMRGGTGADKIIGGPERDRIQGGPNGWAWAEEFPDKSNDTLIGAQGNDYIEGGFAQGGVDHVFGGDGSDIINVAQRGFTGYDFKVTKEVVDCGKGDDYVYRDKNKDVIANNCEHKKHG